MLDNFGAIRRLVASCRAFSRRGAIAFAICMAMAGAALAVSAFVSPAPLQAQGAQSALAKEAGQLEQVRLQSFETPCDERQTELVRSRRIAGADLADRKGRASVQQRGCRELANEAVNRNRDSRWT